MAFDYATWQIAAILAIYLFAAVVKGVTGLGFSTTCLPLLTFVVGLKEALPLVIIPSVSSNLVVMYGAGRFPETIKRFWPMLLATLPGLILGLWALSMVNGQQAGAALGLILVVWSLFTFFNPTLRLPKQWERPVAPVSGFLTGLMNGITGSQVVPSVPFLMMLNLDRNLFIQAVNCSFTLSSIVMLLGLSRLGLFTTDAAILSVIGTGVIFFGLKFGTSIQRHLSPNGFRITVLAMLMIMGLSLLAEAF